MTVGVFPQRDVIATPVWLNNTCMHVARLWLAVTRAKKKLTLTVGRWKTKLTTLPIEFFLVVFLCILYVSEFWFNTLWNSHQQLQTRPRVLPASPSTYSPLVLNTFHLRCCWYFYLSCCNCTSTFRLFLAMLWYPNVQLTSLKFVCLYASARVCVLVFHECRP